MQTSEDVVEPPARIGDAEARYRALFESASDAILLMDGDGRYIDANPAAIALLGYGRQELLSMRFVDVVAAQPEWTEEEVRRFLDQRRWTGEMQLRCKDGSLVRIGISATRVDEEPGPIYVSVLRDVTDRKQIREERAELLRAEREARAQADAARHRVHLVSAVSELLAVSLDYPGTFLRLAELMVREVADLCLIDMVDEYGAISRVAAVHASQSKQALADRLGREYPPVPGSSHPVAKTLLTGEPQLSPVMPEGLLRAITQDGEHLRIVQELGFQSSLSVPLIARGRTIGVLTLISTNPDIRYAEPDVRLAEEIARRAAVRIDNARLYDERDHTARVLQRSLLPPDLPPIPHVDLAARYLPLGEGNEVGGDFYDVFDGGDGSWVAVVGDVCGKGPEAAAVMGLVRHTLRALARFQRRPSRLLQELNGSLLEQSVNERFCTVCYLRLRPSADHVRITLCSAGHPLPLVLRHDGTVTSVGQPGQLLGVFPEVSLVDSVIDLRLGDALVIYTDGAIEQRGMDPVTGRRRLADAVSGEERLRGAVAASIGCDAEATAARIEEALHSARGASPPIDDVALLVIRAGEMPSQSWGGPRSQTLGVLDVPDAGD
jgi:PAS domain S-box-containing protein